MSSLRFQKKLLHSVAFLGAYLLCISQSRRQKLFTTSDLQQFAESPESPESRDCAATIKRLDLLKDQGQNLDNLVGDDPLFSPVIDSIAARGAICGDSARQTSQTDCAKFNQWVTFQDVAGNTGKPFKAIGSEVTFRDIKQGELANCYFLAALAAITVTHPEVIKNMFVETHLWEKNLFKTKWLINGDAQTLVVDNMIPGNTLGTFFAQPTPTGEFWPVILEKTWAKVFGSFRALDGGDSREVIRAITRAPARYINFAKDDHTAESIWRILEDGRDAKHPMIANTCEYCKVCNCDGPKSFNLDIGHAYAVLSVYSLEIGNTTHNVVKMFNPWAKHDFKGHLDQTAQLNGPESGVFTILATEFFEAFSYLSVNYVNANNKASSAPIPAGVLNALQVSVPASGTYWMSLVWPSGRLVQPCPYLEPKHYLRIALAADTQTLVGKELNRMRDDNDFVVEFENVEEGVYNVLTEIDFRDNSSWMNRASLTVYGPGPASAKITTHASSPAELAIQMLGPACKVASLPGAGLCIADMETFVGSSIPTYWSPDKQIFVYYYPIRNQWHVASSTSLERVQQGEILSSQKNSKNDFICGCSDAEGGVPNSFFEEAIPCNLVTSSNHSYDNVVCHGSDQSGIVQRFCPVTCGKDPDDSGKKKKVCPQGTEPEEEEVQTIPVTPQQGAKEIDICGRIEGLEAVGSGMRRKKRRWGGSCKCPKNAVLGKNCPSEHNFYPGSRYYSKKTLANLERSTLADCKCVWLWQYNQGSA